MSGLTDPIRIETATFLVHQVSSELPQMLELSEMLRIIGLEPLPLGFPSRLFGLLNVVGKPRDTMATDDDLGLMWCMTIMEGRKCSIIRI